MDIYQNIAQYLSPLDTVVRAEGDEPLSSALALIAESDEPVFIFDKKKFLGLLTTYSAEFRRRYPYHTKARHCLVIPPYITRATPLSNVIRSILELKAYSLPVFGEPEGLGVIAAQTVLREVAKDKKLWKRLIENVMPHAPVTILEHAFMKDAYPLMHAENISRLLVTDARGKVVGILARHDLQKAWLTPFVRERFSKKLAYPQDFAFDEKEKMVWGDLPIQRFFRKNVFTASLYENRSEGLKKMLQAGRGSFIMVNREFHPVGFLTIHDLLVALEAMQEQAKVRNIVIKMDKDVSRFYTEPIELLLERFYDKLDKRTPVLKFELHVKSAESPQKKLNEFRIHSLVDFYSGDRFFSETVTRNFLLGLKENFRRVDAEIRRQHKKITSTAHRARETEYTPGFFGL